jgi:hypothetical protein
LFIQISSIFIKFLNFYQEVKSIVIISQHSQNSSILKKPQDFFPTFVIETSGKMSNSEIWLIVNSVLLGVISLLFFAIGYFLKDLHKDFKKMIDRVNTVHSELNTHVSLFENLAKVFQKQIDRLNERIKQLEKKLETKK